MGAVAVLEARERTADETVWAKELLAQACGERFDRLWDALNAATNRFETAAAFALGAVVLGDWSQPRELSHGVSERVSLGRGETLAWAAWRSWLGRVDQAGWRLGPVEFRHQRFTVDGIGRARESGFWFSAHLENEGRAERATVTGELVVEWDLPGGEKSAGVAIQRVDASGLTVRTRAGPPPFELTLSEVVTPLARLYPISPLMAYDLDGDGSAEILLPGVNLFYRRTADGGYRSSSLCRHAPTPLFTAVVADFTGDGAADLLGVKVEGLLLLRGSGQGAFEERGQPVWVADRPLQNPMVLTCGDIDGDGDLDVFLGQYRVPTLGQALEPNYYGAEDGYPAYLLLNDGPGGFRDVTVAAGLERKRRQRTYSASFVDLDEDGDLDLAVVSDFAGLSLYRNDGQGGFADVTGAWVEEPLAFGMAHTLTDFNADGRLDLLMIGMNSPTADRLAHLGLVRAIEVDPLPQRRAMTFGNRLFVARPQAGFDQTTLNETIARSGWSWGTSAADFDLDGYPDVYIANGNETRQSVRDYETEFWLHDLYLDRSVDDVTASAYLLAKHARTRGAGWSYGGYEKNRLYLNERGERFIELGHLLGVALEEDCRNVVTEDLDGDGRLDLLVTTYEFWPVEQQVLRVYRNRLTTAGHWIGFRLREAGPGRSPVGVRMAIEAGEYRAVRSLVTGDSFRSQHSPTAHFGLGQVSRVDRVRLVWPDGRTTTLVGPEVNRYHGVEAPGR
ncbi:MAG: CRTAC1 family protein [Verrucomicrobia bacterium]|nr:CRTAC1 family protein [Verrucomicrobiota bacterium]